MIYQTMWNLNYNYDFYLGEGLTENNQVVGCYIDFNI